MVVENEGHLQSLFCPHVTTAELTTDRCVLFPPAPNCHLHRVPAALACFVLWPLAGTERRELCVLPSLKDDMESAWNACASQRGSFIHWMPIDSSVPKPRNPFWSQPHGAFDQSQSPDDVFGRPYPRPQSPFFPRMIDQKTCW